MPIARILKRPHNSEIYRMANGSNSAFAVGGLLEEVRPQSAGHLPFVRDATANDSFHTLRAGAIDPDPAVANATVRWLIPERTRRLPATLRRWQTPARFPVRRSASSTGSEAEVSCALTLPGSAVEGVGSPLGRTRCGSDAASRGGTGGPGHRPGGDRSPCGATCCLTVQ